jgi:hypothetical protein
VFETTPEKGDEVPQVIREMTELNQLLQIGRNILDLI